MTAKKTNNPNQSNPYSYYYGRSNHSNAAPPKNYAKKAPPKKLHRSHKLALFLILLLICCGVGFFAFAPDSGTDHILNTIKNSLTKPAPAQPVAISPAALTAMGSQINSVISQNSDIDMAVGLIDLSNNQAENYGDQTPFTAASTTKVITAAYFLNQVEAGNQTLSETVNGETAEYELQQMIVVSDDNAWDALNNLLGYPNLQSYADSIGADSFNSVNNTLSCSDMALVLEKLWEGKLLNQADTSLLLGYLKQANYREYIVPAVPAGDTIYHKIGLYEDNVHDAAIISNGKQAFVIVIYTNGNGIYDWPARAQIMQQITEYALPVYL